MYSKIIQRVGLNNLKSNQVLKQNFSQTKALTIRGLEKEPKEPMVNTAVPGPRSQELTQELSKIQVEYIFQAFLRIYKQNLKN
jgi:hypothetical protein